jgi:dihydroorotate dehydrogenase
LDEDEVNMDFYKSCLRPALFMLPPEAAHNLTLALCHCFPAMVYQPLIEKPTALMGLTLRNPVGLSAGLDKNAQCLPAWKAMGFGFVEIGTVTPQPQCGNPKPRLFRLPKYQAIINRLGFNGLGMEVVAENLSKRPNDLVIGVNIGKNKDTPLEKAVTDYNKVLQRLYPYGDYFTLNISSPNTPGLRTLQQRVYLEPLLMQMQEALFLLNQKSGIKKPLVVKIAPDLMEEELNECSEIFLECQLDGIIATNTTLDHSTVLQEPCGQEAGGLSGAPLYIRSTEVLRFLSGRLKNKIALIGVGGILSGQDALLKMISGAEAVQIYTGFIYRGPALIKEIVSAL